MLGRHQVGNACLALAAVECMGRAGLSIPETAIRIGLEQAVWEGRLERVAQRPDIYLDGAHNPASALILADAVRELKQAYRQVIMVVGILKDKDHRGILARLLPLADRVIVTRPAYERAMDPDALAAEVRRDHHDVETAGSVAGALARAREGAADEDLIMVSGSLYTVWDARAALGAAAATAWTAGLKG